MRLKIFQIGEPVLRQVARELSREEILSAKIQQLISFMQATLYDAPGVGLAAPQIGESLQLIVIEDKKEYWKNLSRAQLEIRERKEVPFHVIINPKLTIEKTEVKEFYEGCLSIPAFMGVVPRALAVKVECLNEKAEPVTIHAQGWYARILQHEINHLQGILCIDHMKLQTLTTFENYNKYWLSSQ